MGLLTGKTALITGAAYGFGKEFVKQAAKRKMKIVAVDIMEDELMKLEDVAKEFGAEDITLIPADVSLYEETEKVVKATMDKYGQIDLLMNNAGTCTPGYGFMIPLQDWEWIIRTNFLSHVYFMRQVIPIMKAQGTHCNILNVCSIAGLITSNAMPGYYSTKHAAVQLSRATQYELEEIGADIQVSPDIQAEPFQNAHMVEALNGSCPDADMLLAYAEAMNQVAAYRGHMSNKDVAGDRKLLSIVQDMPEGYKGTLAEKIVPFRRLIIAMNEAAEKEAELDKKNAQKHAANLSKGKYGGIHPGDSEDNITAAYGEPSRVNVSEGEGKKMKQYVFNHNGKSIYVYTQDGIVTDVSM